LVCKRWDTLGCSRMLEVRHDFSGKQPQALEHLLLGNFFHTVQEEIDAVYANRLPTPHGAENALRVPEGQSLRPFSLAVRPYRLPTQLRQQAQRLVRLR